MKKYKSICGIILILALLIGSIPIYAEDNADSGTGNTGNALADKGYYRGSEYMYKVSVYVGLSDQSDQNTDLDSEWKMIGTKPIYVKPSNFTLSSNVFFGVENKANYQNGSALAPSNSSIIVTDDPPPIPITNGGNIGAVKSYFGDVNTLDMFINYFAAQKGTTREGLVESIVFNINGESKNYPAEEILPIKVDGEYQNKVPWLIVYEPVIISYLKDGTTVLAFTATEYALAQKLGYFNFRGGSDGQYISGMTHSDLPNSIFLEESWFGFPVTSALPDNVYWDLDRIIAGGGWGMRLLKANADNVVENDTEYDYEYRVDTDVITSVRIYADEDVTPDNRHESEAAYSNPVDNTATITMTANGYTSSTEVVIPAGGSELVWLKWHTPSIPGDVTIQVNVTGNSAAKIDGTSRSATLTGKVVDLSLSEPPNPTANDRNDDFILPDIPSKAEKTTANWGIYDCNWIPVWVWHPKWEWEADWHRVSEHGWIGSEEDRHWGVTGHHWVDRGLWVDNGNFVDEGYWEYDYTNYYASLTGTMTLEPDEHSPTADEEIMKSGYGVDVNVSTYPVTNAPASHITNAQNVITYFPEFSYETYWRLLEEIGSGEFVFKENKYSTYSSRVHFTSLWFPDERYSVYAEIIDLWTPDGMLRINVTDDVTIDGDLYMDWHIGPK
ncbi:hypothetical protein KHM83_17700 [Fusibacter paucivorans]|uniref:Uncharacterized protein n=1 Tax=Fusibacter paucivorans TaxID=76009 RepID=A0ABS5PTM2_9FIRM|nr:hypothetical protein [Fusibacter paucivorans]MBS7528524.1 hypothetical protein [Fusibacter paucivorans]